jgi:hypothetical protein
LLLAVPVIAHCNAIVGVENVHLAQSKGNDAGSQPHEGDDDDSTLQHPTTNPSSSSTSPGPDSGPPPAKGCNGDQNCPRIAFVTRAVFDGNLGGLSGADKKCNDAAKAVPALAGLTFGAWLSDSDNAARSRLPQGKQNYTSNDAAKTPIATNFDDLTDGTVMAAIQFDETGKSISDDPNEFVWTGTLDNGESAADTCQNWTVNEITTPVDGLVGDTMLTDSGWTNDVSVSCNASNHLICLEF